ncbi:MAG: purine-nucleoside phosphorylase [Deltaproteobacteria bacterium]|nr:purine-nucleoside phosphorylase [Deltaproteobacteria bacterium]
MSSTVGHPQVQAAAAFARERLGARGDEEVAAVGVVLGSGLGHVADVVEENGGKAVEYSAMPHFPTSSVEGHKGRLVAGRVGGARVVLMQGRVHRYEGYSAAQVVFPVRVLHALGVRRLLVTNAAGGLGDGFVAGDLMLIEDHLNLTGDNPLVGANDARFGARFPDLSDAYAARLRELAVKVATERSIALRRGVYAGLLGPSYETPAEIRMLKTLGAHAVGMSTVHEVIAANHLGMEVLGISCITNLAAGISPVKLSHDEVKETATRVGQVFSGLVLQLIPTLA